MTEKLGTPIDDQSRAQINGFRVCKSHSYVTVYIEIDDLVNLVEAYRGRKYNEEITYLEHKLGGN